jgi:hypothetical protein
MVFLRLTGFENGLTALFCCLALFFEKHPDFRFSGNHLRDHTKAQKKLKKRRFYKVYLKIYQIKENIFVVSFVL